MFQLNVCAEYLIEYFPGFLLRLLSIGFGLFDTDDLTALGTFAEEMTGAIHFVPGAKPTHVGQFWFLHAPSFSLAEPFSYRCGNQTDPLPNLSVTWITSVWAHLDNLDWPNVTRPQVAINQLRIDRFRVVPSIYGDCSLMRGS